MKIDQVILMNIEGGLWGFKEGPKSIALVSLSQLVRCWNYELSIERVIFCDWEI